MNQMLRKTVFLLAMLFIPPFPKLDGQTVPSAQAIREKNIEAVGGKESLAKISNFSFQAGSNWYYVRPDGMMKVVTGRNGPVVLAATMVAQDVVKQNYFHQIRTIEGTEKSCLQCLAKLIGGLFSLVHFDGPLAYGGMKSFGPEKRLLLSTKAYGLDVIFSVDADSYLVRGMSLKNFTPEEGHFEISYEFGIPGEIWGHKIPSSIYYAPVGTQSSLSPDPMEISNVDFDLDLPDQFFSQIEVNIGEVTTGVGFLKGNVLDIVLYPPRPSFVVVTNWQREDVEKAGLRTGEKLVLSLDGIESELTFHLSQAEVGSADYTLPNARFMSMDPLRGGLYYIYFNPLDKEEAESIKSRLAPLLPIRVKRK